MKKIDLAESFEKTSAVLSSLPFTDSLVSRWKKDAFKQTNVNRLLREIYEAANGRQVATTIGFVSIAPAIAPSLKDKPYWVKTQAEFISQALARIASGPSKRAARSELHRGSVHAAPACKTRARSNERQLVTSGYPCSDHT
jgi:hypothetical protein